MAMNSNGWIRRDVLVLARDHILPRASKISSLCELEKGVDSVQVRRAPSWSRKCKNRREFVVFLSEKIDR